MKTLNNNYFFTFVFLGLVSLVLDFFGDTGALLGSAIIVFGGTFCIIKDITILKEAGIDAPSRWWILFFPVYAVKRILRTGLGNKWIFIYFGVVVASMSSAILHEEQDVLDASICQVATSIKATNYDGQTLRCIKVLDRQETYKNNYRGGILMSDQEVYDYKATVSGEWVEVTLY